MTSVLLTTSDGEKISVSALNFEFARSVATGSYEEPSAWEFFMSMGAPLPQFVPDGGRVTQVFMKSGRVVFVNETPEDVNELMRAVKKPTGTIPVL